MAPDKVACQRWILSRDPLTGIISALKKFLSTDVISDYWDRRFDVLYWISSSLFLLINLTICPGKVYFYICKDRFFVHKICVQFLSSNISSGCRIDSLTLKFSSRETLESRIACRTDHHFMSEFPTLPSCSVGKKRLQR